MPKATPSPRPRRRTATTTTTARRPGASASGARALLIIDNTPLQRAAWAEYHTARKQHEKVSRQRQRHEEVDLPEYEKWLHLTFPIFITTLRQLHEEVFLKGQKIEAVHSMHMLSGRSLKKLWRELKEQEANPEAFKDEFDEDDDSSEPGQAPKDKKAGEARDFFDELFGDEEGFSSKSEKKFRDEFEDDFFSPPGKKAKPKKTSADAKEIYRRLVQKLHPDRGGEWTSVRKRLWHEVQQAWAARDLDWLTRLEVDWETANDVLTLTSPLSRLRRAVEELQTARREIERKLREYRESLAWRFTENEKARAALRRRLEDDFNHDLHALRRQLAHLNETIAAWERPTRSRQSGAKKRSSRTWLDDDNAW